MMRRIISILLLLLLVLFAVGCSKEITNEQKNEDTLNDKADNEIAEGKQADDVIPSTDEFPQGTYDGTKDSADNDLNAELPESDSSDKLVAAEQKIVTVNKKEQKEKQESAKILQEIVEFTIVADEKSINPQIVEVKKGQKVKITFEFNDDKIYFGGLDLKSDYWNTVEYQKGSGKNAVVEFIADKSFSYTGYWPDTAAKKASGQVRVVE